MLYFNINNPLIKSAAVLDCISYIKENDNLINGTKTELNNEIKVSITEYNTKPEDERIWEAHKQFVDFHIMLSGAEEIHISDICKMKCGEYQYDKDYLPVIGQKDIALTIKEQYAVLLLPEDAHKTGVRALPESSTIRKATFKIPVELIINLD